MTSPASLGVPDHRRNLLQCYARAIDAVAGREVVARSLAGAPGSGKVLLVAVGKAAVQMAAGAHDALGDRISETLIITRRGHADPLLAGRRGVRVLLSAHPVPDADSLAAGAALLEFVARADHSRSLLCLMSGGASALAEVLPEGFGAADLARINRWLLGSGLDIHAVNRIRKRISRLKAGRLAGALGPRAQARVLVISDVPGDDPRSVGSGPLSHHVPADLALGGLPIELPSWLCEMTERAPELPDPGVFERVDLRVIAGNADARAAAARAAREQGYPVIESPRVLTGDAVHTGRDLAHEVAGGAPGAYLWGGETTVTLPASPGRGGRCQSLALAFALEVEGREELLCLAAGTDGADGPGEDAGALVDGGTVARGADAGLDPRAALDAADAGSFLEASGDLLHTGPTGTNVMDLVMALRTGE